MNIPDIGLKPFQSLLADLVSEPSISSPMSEWDQSNQGVIAKLDQWFQASGFRTEVRDIDGLQGKSNLIASMGTGTGGLVLAGHTDTVPYDQTRWSSDPFVLQQRDGRFYGLGTCDMKGFFPIIIEALRALEGAELKAPLIVLATADEESSMSGARALAKQGPLPARAAVIGEPTSIRPIRMHKGIMMESIRVTGRSGHSSNPALGRSALEDMHILIAELLSFRGSLQRKYQHPLFEVDVPSLNLGHIHGGDSPNRICAHCELSFDLRPLPGMNTIKLREELDGLLRECAHKHQLNLKFEPLIESVEPFETAADAELVKICEQLTGCSAEAVAFATEAPFLTEMGLETVVMGAGSIDQAHQPDEFLACDQVEQMAKVLSALITKYCIA
jgi:acetylornithine deacetylase